jgi:hypothetical protein
MLRFHVIVLLRDASFLWIKIIASDSYLFRNIRTIIFSDSYHFNYRRAFVAFESYTVLLWEHKKRHRF